MTLLYNVPLITDYISGGHSCKPMYMACQCNFQDEPQLQLYEQTTQNSTKDRDKDTRTEKHANISYDIDIPELKKKQNMFVYLRKAV